MKAAKKMGSFIVEKVGEQGGRIGSFQLTEETVWTTPMFFIHTLTGSVPHIASEVFDMLYSPTSIKGVPPVQISVDTTFPFHENVLPSGLPISRFVGLPNCASFLTVHNPLSKPKPGFNDKLGVSIWSRNGRQVLNVSKHIQIVNDFQPNFFQVLSDFDVSRTSSKKRVKKSTARNLEFLCAALEKTDRSKSLPFATLEAAWFLADPVEGHSTLAQYIEKHIQLGGFVINGLKEFDPRDGNDLEILNGILSKLPESKPRYAAGDFDLLDILRLVSQGFDFFDSSVVTRLTNAGKALVLPFDDFIPTEQHSHPPNESLPAVNGDNSEAEDSEAEQAYLDLNEKRYFDDFNPVLKSCGCYTCRKYTRSYLHHLISTNELLAPVLLMYHNLYQFGRFFEAIRHCLEDDERMVKFQLNLVTRIPVTSVEESETVLRTTVLCHAVQDHEVSEFSQIGPQELLLSG